MGTTAARKALSILDNSAEGAGHRTVVPHPRRWTFRDESNVWARP